MTYGRYPYGGVAYAGADAAEIPADTDTHLAVEVAFTTGALAEPVWVDITTDVRSWDTSRGRTRELERFQPGWATVVLSNLSRQYDSVNAAGPWSGNLRPGRRIRIRETFSGVTYPVFDGYIDRWQLDYPGTGKDATATITATDGFKILARTDLPDSVYTYEVTTTSPRIWWRLNEDLARLEEGKALDAQVVSASRDGDFVNDPYVGGQGLIVNDPGTSMVVTDPDTAVGTPIQGVSIPSGGAGGFDVLAQSQWAIEAWVRPANTKAGGITDAVWTIMGSLDALPTIAALSREDTATFDNRFVFFVYNAARTTYYGKMSGIDAAVPGAIYHIVCTREAGGQLRMYINGVEQTADITGGGGSVLPNSPAGRPFNVGHNPTGAGAEADHNWIGEIDEVAVYTTVPSAARISAHYAAGTHPWQDDLPGVRIGRILDIVGWPASLREIDTGLTSLQSASLDTAALEHLQKVAETEFGLVFVARNGNVRFVDRTAVFARVPGTAVYGDGAGEVGYRAFTPDDGDEVIRNRALISRLNGAIRTSEDAASITEFGRFDYALDGLFHRTEAYSETYADFIVAEYHEPRRRITSLELGPAIVGQEAALYPAMLGPELGDAIVVRSRPVGGGATFEQTCVVEGIEHAGRPGGERTARFILSPELQGAIF
jgi:hypothetical protein